MKQLLICNATVIGSQKVEIADVLVDEGKIIEINPKIDLDAKTVIDANGKYLFPGAIDAHTHMELPVMGTHSSDSFESGTRAALFGGTTTIIDFANQEKGKSAIDAVSRWHRKADGKCFTDYAFHISITDPGNNLEELIKTLIHTHGITSFKTFLAYPNMQISAKELDTLMQIVAKHGGLVTCHCEIGETITQLTRNFIKERDLSHSQHAEAHPAEAETEAIEQFISLAIKNQCPAYVVHTSTGKGCNIISQAKEQFQQLYIETCPQYLLLDDSYYDCEFEQACGYIMSPPLRSKKNLKQIWKHIKDGNVDVIATDHCPFTLEQKSAGIKDFTKIPNGAPGVEDRFELFYHYAVNIHGISLTHFTQMIATNPATIFGLAPRKGDIVVGADADLVLLDPNRKKVITSKQHHMNVDYNPYEGFEIQGAIQTVIKNGVVAVDNQTFLLEHPSGQYLSRKVCPS